MIVVSLLLIFAAVVLLVVGVAGQSDAALIGSIVATLAAVVVLIVSARRAATVRLAAAADGTGAGPTVHSGPTVGMVIDGTVVERPTGRSAGRNSDAGRSTSGAAREAPRDGAVLLDEGEDANAATATIPVQPRPPLDLDLEPDDVALTGLDPGGPDRDDLDPLDLDPGDLDPLDLDPGDLDPGDLDLDDPGEDDFDDADPPDEPPAQLVSASDQALIALMDTNVLVVDGRPRYHLARCPHLRGREPESLPVREAVELGFTPCARCEPAAALLAGARQS